MASTLSLFQPKTGLQLSAFGSHSSAIGLHLSAIGSHLSAIGLFSSAIGLFSSAIGLHLSAIGLFSSAISLLQPDYRQKQAECKPFAGLLQHQFFPLSICLISSGAQRKVLRTEMFKFPRTKENPHLNRINKFCASTSLNSRQTLRITIQTLDKSVSQVSKTMTSARLFKSQTHACSTSKQSFFVCVYKKMFSPTKCRNNSLTEKFTFVFILGLWMIILLLCVIFSSSLSSLIP